ncbi:hypothetical protein H5410_045926 [Solanum commersonii]|uniref:Uncharacterized protein n=1 Tax=Solanum commersonii TaxID=4109 RepID=A0A9J5XE48_SOLCO|nr:hypothetical protein H5410_045926 [Solanum commersonii]
MLTEFIRNIDKYLGEKFFSSGRKTHLNGRPDSDDNGKHFNFHCHACSCDVEIANIVSVFPKT